MEMSKVSERADAPKAVREAVQKGLNGFNDKAVCDSIIEAHNQAEIAGTAAEAKAAAAFQVAIVASDLRHSDQNKTLDDQAFQTGWRYNMRGIYQRLHAAEVTWVERTESKDKDGNQTVSYKLTKYGRNISSDSQQGAVLLSNEAVKECGSLQALRKAIKERKAELAAEAMTANQVECAELAAMLEKGVKAILAELVELESPDAYTEVITRMAAIADYVAQGRETEAETAEVAAA
jgi:hypothetical protein